MEKPLDGVVYTRTVIYNDESGDTPLASYCLRVVYCGISHENYYFSVVGGEIPNRGMWEVGEWIHCRKCDWPVDLCLDASPVDMIIYKLEEDDGAC